jgi:hypothetical protein
MAIAQDNRVMADFAIETTMEQREQIIGLLLEGEPAEIIAENVGVSTAQVNAVAETIKPQLRQAERERENELRSLLMSASIKAWRYVNKRLSDDDNPIPDKMLPSVAGVSFDKWFALVEGNSTAPAVVVAGNATLDDAVGRAMNILKNVSDRVGDLKN